MVACRKQDDRRVSRASDGRGSFAGAPGEGRAADVIRPGIAPGAVSWLPKWRNGSRAAPATGSAAADSDC